MESNQKVASPNQGNEQSTETVLRTETLDIYYGKFLAVKGVSMAIPKNRITAFIGPSGCGKSTLIRCFNRLNDLIDSFHIEGKVYYRQKDLYDKSVDPVEVRRRIGMVFQKPNPFPKTIYDNIAYGARVNNYKGDLDELVENSLRAAALWDEVKDKLKTNGMSLSGGQQQRLCIARAIAINPDVVLMDEPCASLDPISTLKVEDLMHELKQKYSIVIVTHNMQQATRVADMTAFFNARATEKGGKQGYLVEYDETENIFQNPKEEATKDYVSGRFG
ncbi:phosphate ABC transporter, ATP-binding protein [Coleofasciculus chthonoplastes PCC 7420]|uniref:Phosphate ABC transporter, ATP-binding protein n=1 Tax=Coleofasciculus chthonoplastes PCC 7420 TaxID=118168 RepID=B4VWQ2_9CYAN|nr:phosphate ABC transporter ATP-binding protein PstB [Coleofasciculus chthonoplastes]EDX73722.1 phosphate ABC transporter, ATP-binding protein [Coleofasciculus chthonoplastes PCC 7420]